MRVCQVRPRVTTRHWSTLQEGKRSICTVPGDGSGEGTATVFSQAGNSLVHTEDPGALRASPLLVVTGKDRRNSAQKSFLFFHPACLHFSGNNAVLEGTKRKKGRLQLRLVGYFYRFPDYVLFGFNLSLCLQLVGCWACSLCVKDIIFLYVLSRCSWTNHE